MNIKEAIKYYQKAQEESRAAKEAAEKAATEDRAAWDKVRDIYKSRFDGSRKESAEYIAAKEASEKEKAARAAADLSHAVTLAAAHNVLEVARNAIYEEVTTNPEKYNKPVHYKVMKDRLNAICSGDLYISQSFSGLYLHMMYAPGNSEIFLFDTNNDNTINLDRPYLKDRAPEFTLNQIKKEAKQAAKDAEKLRKAAEEFYKKSEAMRNKYASYIKYLMPHTSTQYFLTDDYKLF